MESNTGNSVGMRFMKDEDFSDAKKKITLIRKKLYEERQKSGFGIKTSDVSTPREIFKRAIKV
jgi:hypothetical protein